MPAGRPPKSDEEKKRRGTYRPSRSTGNEIAPLAATPKRAFKPAVNTTINTIPELAPPRKRGRPRKHPAPNTITPQTEWEKLFDDSIQIMDAYKTRTDWDNHMITMMCNEFKKYIEHKDHPLIEINPISGMTAESAASKISKKALDNFTKLAVQLGLTSVMRSRIRVKSDDDKDDDPLQILMNGQKK